MQSEHSMRQSPVVRTMSRTVLLAGIAGGVAELAGVALCTLFTDVTGGEVAQQIALMVFPQAYSPFLEALGVAIHFALSLALAAVFAGAVWQPFLHNRSRAATFAAAMAALAVVWAVNFLAVLPWLNPDFVALMPYGVTLVSKLLFGAAMAGVLNASRQTAPGSATRLELPARKAAR